MQSIMVIVDKLLTNSVLVAQTALRQTSSIIVAYDYGCLEFIRTNLAIIAQ